MTGSIDLSISGSVNLLRTRSEVAFARAGSIRFGNTSFISCTSYNNHVRNVKWILTEIPTGRKLGEDFLNEFPTGRKLGFCALGLCRGRRTKAAILCVDTDIFSSEKVRIFGPVGYSLRQHRWPKTNPDIIACEKVRRWASAGYSLRQNLRQSASQGNGRRGEITRRVNFNLIYR